MKLEWDVLVKTHCLGNHPFPISHISYIQFRWLEIICFQQNPFQKQIWNLEAMFLDFTLFSTWLHWRTNYWCHEQRPANQLTLMSSLRKRSPTKKCWIDISTLWFWWLWVLLAPHLVGKYIISGLGSPNIRGEMFLSSYIADVHQL